MLWLMLYLCLITYALTRHMKPICLYIYWFGLKSRRCLTKYTYWETEKILVSSGYLTTLVIDLGAWFSKNTEKWHTLMLHCFKLGSHLLSSKCCAYVQIRAIWQKSVSWREFLILNSDFDFKQSKISCYIIYQLVGMIEALLLILEYPTVHLNPIFAKPLVPSKQIKGNNFSLITSFITINKLQ